MSCLRSNPPSIFIVIIISLSFSLFFVANASTTVTPRESSSLGHQSLRDSGDVNEIVVKWETTRRSMVENSTMVLAEKRTRRKDPTDNFNRYYGGWNISNYHYWASVGFTAAPFFVIAAVWFVLFGLSLILICLCRCCCPKEPYGYSRTAYALSLVLLIFFTIAAIVGCVVLYTGQGRIHESTTDTLDYVIHQADVTEQSLRNVSGYLAAAKRIGVDAVFLPSDVQAKIDQIQTKINDSATTLSTTTQDNSQKIQDALDGVRLALIIVAAAMLLLVFIGFLFSVFGLQALVYILVIFGWILVTGTFILCGVFLLLHNVVGDTCVAMDQWVQNPTARTALDDILPCVDNATAQETLLRTRDVTYNIIKVVDTVISNVTNRDFPSNAGPLYYNQSGPLMPFLCNPFNSDLTARQCQSNEVELQKAPQVWQGYICEISASGICATTGRLTPTIYGQMEAAVNVSYGLTRYGPFLADLQDCTFVRQTFTDINDQYCPGLRRHSQWVYIGLVLLSAAVMCSLIFWVIYARERRHRVYTKRHDARHGGGDDQDKAP